MNVVNVKDKFFKDFKNFVSIFGCNLNKLSINKVRSDDLGIYYIYYDNDSFYLVIDDLKGYFEKNDDGSDKYLTLIFKDKKQEQIFH